MLDYVVVEFWAEWRFAMCSSWTRDSYRLCCGFAYGIFTVDVSFLGMLFFAIYGERLVCEDIWFVKRTVFATWCGGDCVFIVGWSFWGGYCC